LAGVDVADDDILAIVDVSEGVSKRVTRADLAKLQSGRNLIINGSGRINQRGYVSGTATVGANQFTLDRWFVITSGQNLTFTGTDAGRIMTAPAGGVSQVIEGANIVGGTYVINWTGTATCTVGGVARAKGDTFTLTANTNVTVKFSSGTFSEVQLEAGSIVTPFERVDTGLDLAKCERYFTTQPEFTFSGPAVSSQSFGSQPFRTRMRSTPTLNYTVGEGSGVAVYPTEVAFSVVGTSGALARIILLGIYMDAELIA